MVRPIWDAGTALKIIGVNGSVVLLFIWKKDWGSHSWQWDTVFLLFMCPWDGEHGTGRILLQKHWNLPGGIPSALGSGILALLTGAVVLGGIKRIGKAAECLLPLASGIYILFSLLVLLLCADRIPDVFLRIFQSAFGIRQISGGIAGFGISKSLRYGISRGVFSNEAGLGTLAVLHGPAEHTTPWEQGMWAMFEVFFDTVVICTLTAFVILLATEGRPEAADDRRRGLNSLLLFHKNGSSRRIFCSLFYDSICICHNHCLVLYGKTGSVLFDGAGSKKQRNRRENLYVVVFKRSLSGVFSQTGNCLGVF